MLSLHYTADELGDRRPATVSVKTVPTCQRCPTWIRTKALSGNRRCDGVHTDTGSLVHRRHRRVIDPDMVITGADDNR